MNDYYVYVYIDPRNFEEFYYGKGRGSRKYAHLSSVSESAKSKRIAEIRREGLAPIIRILARDLTEAEALLIEKTLLWKLGKLTTNVATGHFADKFRPHNTLHKELSGFDFQAGLYYYNVGESQHRNWDDYVQFGFISAGQGSQWRDAICGFNEGDVFAAYLKKHGFVGIGKIKTRAMMIREIQINGTPLLSHQLTCQNMAMNSNDPERSEYVCQVEWIKTCPRKEAKRRVSPKVFTTPSIRASLDKQSSTVTFLEESFGVKLREMTR
jgi:uncharacterized protein